MVKPENQVDKQRFEELKEGQKELGRDDERATELAAEEVKQMRRQEGRSKDENQKS